MTKNKIVVINNEAELERLKSSGQLQSQYEFIVRDEPLKRGDVYPGVLIDNPDELAHYYFTGDIGENDIKRRLFKHRLK